MRTRVGVFLLGLSLLVAAVFAAGYAATLVGTGDFGNRRLAILLAGIAVVGFWASWLCLVDRR